MDSKLFRVFLKTLNLLQMFYGKSFRQFRFLSLHGIEKIHSFSFRGSLQIWQTYIGFCDKRLTRRLSKDSVRVLLWYFVWPKTNYTNDKGINFSVWIVYKKTQDRDKKRGGYYRHRNCSQNCVKYLLKTK